jgi:hypothetical protein
MFARKGFGLALAMALATVSLAIAQPPPGPDLAPDQKTRLRAVMDDARKDMHSLRERLDAARKDLSTELNKYDLDNRRINRLAHQINDLQNEILMRHIRTQRDLRKIVNSTQFEQIRRYMRTFDGHRSWSDRKRSPGSRKDR